MTKTQPTTRFQFWTLPLIQVMPFLRLVDEPFYAIEDVLNFGDQIIGDQICPVVPSLTHLTSNFFRVSFYAVKGRCA
jgi:hypothetical protein